MSAAASLLGIAALRQEDKREEVERASLAVTSVGRGTRDSEREISYEEFTRLAETRLARNSSNGIIIV